MRAATSCILSGLKGAVSFLALLTSNTPAKRTTAHKRGRHHLSHPDVSRDWSFGLAAGAGDSAVLTLFFHEVWGRTTHAACCLMPRVGVKGRVIPLGEGSTGRLR